MNDTVAATGLSSEGCFITTSGDDTVESGSEVVPCKDNGGATGGVRRRVLRLIFQIVCVVKVLPL